MRVIVSTKIEGKRGIYRIYTSIKEIDWSKVDVFIYQDSQDTDVDIIFALNNIPETVVKRIYINQTLNSLIYKAFQRINGVIYEDESLLDDEESIDYLCENVGNIGNEILTPQEYFEKLNDCVSIMKKADENALVQLSRNQNYLATLSEASEEMSNALSIDVRSQARYKEFLKVVHQEIEQLEEAQSITTRELTKLKQQLSIVTTHDNALHAYGVYTAPLIIGNVLYVRCVGDIRYLTTFLIFFMQMTKSIKRKKGRLLLLRPSTFVYKYQYKNFYKLDADTISLFNAQTATDELFVTYTPVKQVFEKFFEMSADYTIVLDCLQTGKDIIQTNINIKKCLAYSSISNYNNFERDLKIPKNQIIFSEVGVVGSNIIPFIEGFCTLKPELRQKELWRKSESITKNLYAILNL
jgi:hypothetical protein